MKVEISFIVKTVVEMDDIGDSETSVEYFRRCDKAIEFARNKDKDEFEWEWNGNVELNEGD